MDSCIFQTAQVMFTLLADTTLGFLKNMLVLKKNNLQIKLEAVRLPTVIVQLLNNSNELKTGHVKMW